MLANIDSWKRSVYCGDVTEGYIGKELTLMGWVQVRRDHGGLIFVDLRDREGVVQIVFNPETDSKSHNLAHQIRTEYVLAVKGVVNKRPEGTQNLKLKTGLVEVAVHALKILNIAEAPPFVIEDESDVHENVRLKYRYLDLRRPLIQKNLIFRHKVTRAIREYLSDNAFLEIETPMLTKSTPEGARDYLVPSRMNPGRFYALPQSPQLFKQILMVSGFDKYFQIVRCFRDEDLRADRQPEFTQVDMEMSFVEKADVMEMTEDLIAHIFKETLDIELKLPLTRLTYHESVDRFGVDNPDTRFGLELKDITSLVKSSGFKVFADTAKGGGIVKVLNAKGCSGFSRSELDGLTEVARGCGAKGLAWVRIDEEGWKSPIAKFFKDSEKNSISEAAEASPGDLLLFVADKPKVTNAVLGRMRLNLGERLELIPENTHELLWITDFPLLEFDEDEERYIALHHPFTAPTEESLDKLSSAPLETTSDAYDLVLNGSEIGGGSIRIHRQDIQLKIFKALGIGDDEAKEKFGFLLDALQYGAPPHGGIALGLDRLVTILLGTPSIRDVIAFPKTQKATCLMTDAPSSVNKDQLNELSLRTLVKK